MYRTGHENVGWLFLIFVLEWLSLKYFLCISCCSIRSFYFPCNMESLRALHVTRFLCQGASKWWKFRYFLAVRFHLYLRLKYFCLLLVVVMPYLLVTPEAAPEEVIWARGSTSMPPCSLLQLTLTTSGFYPLAPSSQEFAMTALSRIDLLQQHLQNSSWSSWLCK